MTIVYCCKFGWIVLNVDKNDFTNILLFSASYLCDDMGNVNIDDSACKYFHTFIWRNLKYLLLHDNKK